MNAYTLYADVHCPFTIIPADGLIDERDLATLAHHWLETGCLD